MGWWRRLDVMRAASVNVGQFLASDVCDVCGEYIGLHYNVASCDVEKESQIKDSVWAILDFGLLVDLLLSGRNIEIYRVWAVLDVCK